MRKRVGDPVKLRIIEWAGEMPAAGDVLQTKTGRSYLILRRSGKECKTHHCLVINPAEVAKIVHDGAAVHHLYWMSRKRRRFHA